MSSKIGENINKLRTERNWSLREMEKRTHINYSVLSRIESGKRAVTDSEIKMFSDVFAVSPNELLGVNEKHSGGTNHYYFIDKETAKKIQESLNDKNLEYQELRAKLDMSKPEYQEFKHGMMYITSKQADIIEDIFDIPKDEMIKKTNSTVAGQNITLTEEELNLFNELKKHPIMFHDLASDPEKKVKELIKLYKMKKMFLEDEEEEYGDGFGELED